MKRFQQQKAIDYNGSFASFVKLISYKAIFAIAAALNWEIKQIDMKIAFYTIGLLEKFTSINLLDSTLVLLRLGVKFAS